MKNRAIHVNLPVITALAYIAAGNTSAQQIVPSLQWEHFYEDSACDIVALSQTDDGGYILGGRIYTFADGGGQNDCVLVKTDAQGAIEWQRSYGGSSNEAMRLVQQTPDKGFIFAASSTSPPSGNKEAPHFGLEDAWIVKVDALGNKQWERSFGGGGSDSAASVWQAMDGGYILGGISPGLTGEANFWLVKIDPRGSTEWQRSFEEQISGGLVVQTAEGGFVLAGGLSSPSVAQAPHFGGRDGWIMKIGEEGDKHWEHLFGGSEDDVFLFVDQSDDGGFILGGRSSSPPSGNKESPNHGGFDYWIVRADFEGRKIWDRSFGTDDGSVEQVRVIRQTPDKGYIFGGGFGGGSRIFKLNPSGQVEWDDTLGGFWGDPYIVEIQDLQLTKDGGYILGGSFNFPAEAPSGSGCDYGSWAAKLKTVVSHSGEVVYWNSNAGTVLESAENLNGEWESAQTEVLSIGDAGAIPLVPAGHQRFYRLKADASSNAPTLEFGTLLTWPTEANQQLIYSPNHDATWESYPGDQGNIGGTNYAIIPRDLQQHYFRTQGAE